MLIECTVNGKPVELDVHPMRRLVDLLRDDLGMPGTKEGCGEGECGACGVLMDGRLVNSCLVPAAQVRGCEILTIEGVRETEAGRIIAETFARVHAVQCGFCTPGMVMAALSLLRRNPSPDEGEIRQSLSGNICRCTGYDLIIDGIQEAAKAASDGSVWSRPVSSKPEGEKR